MNKNQASRKLIYLLKLPKNAIITFYRNPKEFSRFDIEKINPDHKLIIWGLLRKKYCCDKKVYKIRMGRVRIPFIMLFYNIKDFIIASTFKFLNDSVIYTVCVCIFSVLFVYTFILYPSMHNITTHPLISIIRSYHAGWY